MSFLCCLAKCCLTFRRKVSRLRQSLPNCLEREFLITVTQRLVPRRMCTPIRVRPYSGICTGSQFPEPQRRREIEVLRFFVCPWNIALHISQPGFVTGGGVRDRE